jgi:hypothetical protein
MVKVIVRIPDEQRRWVFQGSEREVESQLHATFPEETTHALGLTACIEALQADGVAEVSFEVEKPNLESNLLPEDFLTANQGDDPWARKS